MKRIVENMKRRIDEKTEFLPGVTKYWIINSNARVIDFFAAKGKIKEKFDFF